MERGVKRKEILANLPDECTDEFADLLTKFIDDIELELNNIYNLMDIDSISELDQLEDAQKAIDDLKDSIY